MVFRVKLICLGILIDHEVCLHIILYTSVFVVHFFFKTVLTLILSLIWILYRFAAEARRRCKCK